MVGDNMKTFKMKDDDLVLDDTNNLVIISGYDEVRQSIERILTTNKNEWFLNANFGLDYKAIRVKGKTIEEIELALREAIYQDDRITDVTFRQLELSREARQLYIKLDAKVNGEPVEGIEVFASND